MKTHLLIDGDIVAFTAASVAQCILIDEFGWAQPFGNTSIGEANVENMIHALMQGLGGDSFEVILSDPKDNWRRGVDPTYKTNRTGMRPILLDYLKDYLREAHGAYHWNGLEADDVLSYLMTKPRSDDGGRLVCVGRDKDFASIPGLHHMWKKDLDASGKMLIREVSQWEADRFHMIQTLAGDKIDGFDGCPNIGMTRAADIIDTPVLLVPQAGVKTRGVNKGESVTRWMSEPTRDYWACICSHYRKAGLGEEEALVTARLARLLRYGEYNRETEEITLWVPEMLKTVGK